MSRIPGETEMPFSEHGCSNPRRIAQLPDRYVNVYRCARDLHVINAGPPRTRSLAFARSLRTLRAGE